MHRNALYEVLSNHPVLGGVCPPSRVDGSRTARIEGGKRLLCGLPSSCVCVTQAGASRNLYPERCKRPTFRVMGWQTNNNKSWFSFTLYSSGRCCSSSRDVLPDAVPNSFSSAELESSTRSKAVSSAWTSWKSRSPYLRGGRGGGLQTGGKSFARWSEKNDGTGWGANGWTYCNVTLLFPRNEAGCSRGNSLQRTTTEGRIMHGGHPRACFRRFGGRLVASVGQAAYHKCYPSVNSVLAWKHI